MEVRVSVCIPCYNAENYILETLQSLLNQTYKNFEIIVIDDGSEDNSIEKIESMILKDKRIHLYKNNNNRGVAFTRNRAFELCNAEYIAYMDADDTAPPNRLELQVNFLDSHLNIDGVGGSYNIINEKGEFIQKVIMTAQSPEMIKATLLFRNCIANGSVMLRKRVIDEEQIRYDEEKKDLEDYDFWVRFVKNHNFINLSNILQNYRVTQESLSRKCANCEGNLRVQRFDDIHRYVLKERGYLLPAKEEQVYFCATRENGHISGLTEYFLLRRVLWRINKFTSQKYPELRKAVLFRSRELYQEQKYQMLSSYFSKLRGKNKIY